MLVMDAVDQACTKIAFYLVALSSVAMSLVSCQRKYFGVFPLQLSTMNQMPFDAHFRSRPVKIMFCMLVTDAVGRANTNKHDVIHTIMVDYSPCTH